MVGRYNSTLVPLHIREYIGTYKPASISYVATSIYTYRVPVPRYTVI